MKITILATYKYKKIDEGGSYINFTIFDEHMKELIGRAIWEDKTNAQELNKGHLALKIFPNNTEYNLHRDRIEDMKKYLKILVEGIYQHVIVEETFTCSFQGNI